MTARLMIELQAVPERVPSARGAITRLCEDLEIEEDLAGQIRLAVTEACTNCVLHAYADESGTDATFALEARVEDDDLLVVVRDAGAGITAVRSGRAGLGFGLRLMREAASSMDVVSLPGGGTSVAMRFAIR
jgi:anti-sigma regulatory factor (Ser/Thr protein kinase)